jgi:hypothetical protein
MMRKNSIKVTGAACLLACSPAFPRNRETKKTLSLSHISCFFLQSSLQFSLHALSNCEVIYSIPCFLRNDLALMKRFSHLTDRINARSDIVGDRKTFLIVTE